MERVNKIISLFVLLPFFLASMGLTIIQSHCTCTGEKELSFYVAPETCETVSDVVHIHDGKEKTGCCKMDICTSCSMPKDECGCDAPTVKYIKLANQVIQEDSNILKTRLFKQLVIQASILVKVIAEEDINTSISKYIDPPPKFNSCSEFLNLICQRKIPQIA